MDLSGGGGWVATFCQYLEGADAETLWRGDMSSKDPLLSDTEAQGPGDAGPRTFSLERREPDKSQAWDSQSWTPVSPSTSALSWTRSLRRHRGAQPLRSVCVAPPTGQAQDDG